MKVASKPVTPVRWLPTRRVFLQASGYAVAGWVAGGPLALANAAGSKPLLRFGLVTDAHYADTDAKDVRFYRESLTKMAECVALMNAQKVDFLIELGDFKDQGKPATEKSTLAYLAAMEQAFAQFRGPRYHVLGNHDTDSLSKAQFLAQVENTGMAKDAKYYAFDAQGVHCVVLDANYNADGTDYDHGKFKWTEAYLPEQELTWLKADLAATSKPVLVFVHQLLDTEDVHAVRNAPQVRQLLQGSGKVLAVFQGHFHAGGYRRIEGIHYYTLKALIEGSGARNNAYALVELAKSGDITITGYRRAVSKKLPKN